MAQRNKFFADALPLLSREALDFDVDRRSVPLCQFEVGNVTKARRQIENLGLVLVRDTAMHEDTGKVCFPCRANEVREVVPIAAHPARCASWRNIRANFTKTGEFFLAYGTVTPLKALTPVAKFLSARRQFLRVRAPILAKLEIRARLVFLAFIPPNGGNWGVAEKICIVSIKITMPLSKFAAATSTQDFVFLKFGDLGGMIFHTSGCATGNNIGISRTSPRQITPRLGHVAANKFTVLGEPYIPRSLLAAAAGAGRDTKMLRHILAICKSMCVL